MIVEDFMGFRAQIYTEVFEGFKYFLWGDLYRLKWVYLTRSGFIYNPRLDTSESMYVKTKEEAEKLIYNYKKYPIYHEYK